MNPNDPDLNPVNPSQPAVQPVATNQPAQSPNALPQMPPDQLSPVAPEPKSKKKLVIICGIILVIVGLFCVWFFVMRQSDTDAALQDVKEVVLEEDPDSSEASEQENLEARLEATGDKKESSSSSSSSGSGGNSDGPVESAPESTENANASDPSRKVADAFIAYVIKGKIEQAVSLHRDTYSTDLRTDLKVRNEILKGAAVKYQKTEKFKDYKIHWYQSCSASGYRSYIVVGDVDGKLKVYNIFSDKC